MDFPPFIDRRYKVLSLLGTGLSGEIYEVEGPEGRVALKLLRQAVPGLKEEERLATFKFEFSLLKGLSHPHIVKIFDFGFDEVLKRFYFTEELVDGVTLLDFSNSVGARHAVPLPQIQELFLQALQGLAYLHSHDIIHGDLKPGNLLVTSPYLKHPILKIIDFGISHPSFVGYGGTPAFMAPEKILKEPVDARSDLYSLAVVFYTILIGENPFLRNHVLATLQAHLKFIPPSATIRRPELDPVWGELLAMMLKKNPRYRMSSAAACIKFLETKGEAPLVLEKPKVLPPVWTGRPEILEAANSFLDSLTQSKVHRLLIVSGEPGLGKENLLTELKYAAELKGIQVLQFGEETTREPALLFLKIEENTPKAIEAQLPLFLKNYSLILAIRPALEEKILAAFNNLTPQLLRLRPLNREETLIYLQEVTSNQKIPTPFLNALYRWSRGYPSHLNETLQKLLRDPLIVDSSGKWNLAVFNEGEPSLEQLGLSESSLLHALAGNEVSDLKERWNLHLRLAEALAKQAAFDDALTMLTKLENELPQIFERPQRLTQRARLLEKRGWIYTKQNRYREAREAYASALSLLKESETSERVLECRLKNFIAFLDLQEGRWQDAIHQYEKTAKEASQLSEDEQRIITNNELGSAYLSTGKIENAIARLQKDLEFFAKLSDASLQMKTSYNLGEAYSKAKEYEKAFQAYEQVAKIARDERQWDYLIRAYNGLGNISSLRKEVSQSLDYYQRSLALAEYLRDYVSAATVAQNRGVILNEADRLEEALHDLELSKQLLSKVQTNSHTRYLMARATLELGEVYRKKKDFQLAQSYFAEALNRSEEDPNLKSFRFYPLASSAKLALEEGKFETFRELYPKLIHQASNEEEKRILAQLLSQAPADPSRGQESPVGRDKKIHDISLVLKTPFPEPALLSILKINRALITEHQPENLFKKILQYATELSGAESALLLEVSEQKQLEIREAFNAEIDPSQKEISQQIAHRVLTTGQPIVTRDAQVDKEFNQFNSVLALHLKSIACIPIHIQQKVVGLLYLTHRMQSGLFTPEIVSFLEAFSDQAGLALQNAHFVQQLKRFNFELQNQLEDAEAEIDRLKINLRSKVKNPYPKILGKSHAIVEILQLMDRISDTPLSVLIFGETGSGKELVAHSIHDNSRRHKAGFVAVNCGAIPENLIESELFGYRAGAFTGATHDKKGLLEEAHGGTLFLDEISELPLNTQVKLLRALQEKEIRRLGDTKAIPVDIRIIAATHRYLEDWIAAGKFREDLYYRIAQMVITVPPLRDRREDIPLLAEHFLTESCQEIGMKKIPRLGKDLLEILLAYHWPGNVRELENVIRTAAAFAEHGIIHRENLPAFLLKRFAEGEPAVPSTPSAEEELVLRIAKPSSSPSSVLSPVEANLYHPQWTWQQYEEAIFAKSLLKHQMNCEKVAAELGVGIATVYVKIRKYGLKNNATKYEKIVLPIPEGMTLNALKHSVIEEAFRKYDQSPYAVARQLGLNVGTIYRHLSSSNHID